MVVFLFSRVGFLVGVSMWGWLVGGKRVPREGPESRRVVHTWPFLPPCMHTYIHVCMNACPKRARALAGWMFGWGEQREAARLSPCSRSILTALLLDRSVRPPVHSLPPRGRFALVAETGKAVMGQGGAAPAASFPWIVGVVDDPNPAVPLPCALSIDRPLDSSSIGGVVGGWMDGWTFRPFFRPRPQTKPQYTALLHIACCMRACLFIHSIIDRIPPSLPPTPTRTQPNMYTYGRIPRPHTHTHTRPCQPHPNTHSQTQPKPTAKGTSTCTRCSTRPGTC